MTQALARATDPMTSHAAASAVDTNRLEGLILERLRKCRTGATTRDLARWLKIDLVSVSPRMKPLKDKGLVMDTGFRARGISGRQLTIWRAL